MLDGKLIDAAQVKQLAMLLSCDEMLSQFGAGLQSPMAAFAGAMNGLLSMFTGALEALRAQKQS